MKPTNNPLRDVAVPYKAFEGAVTFWMLPYTNMEVDIRLSELRRLEPPEKWVHADTGEETYKDPHPNPGDDPIIEAQRKASKWEHVDLWGNIHSIFWGVVPLTIDIEFKDKKLPTPARGLQAYWENRNGSTAHNWTLFKQLIGGNVGTEWMSAYIETRDTSMDGPEDLQVEPGEDADPNA